MAVAGAFFAGASPAQAACHSSTPSNAAFADAIDGEAGLAPEITTVQLAVDGACNYAANPGIIAPLVEDDAVFTYVDTDGNAATGSPLFGGADITVGVLGQTGADSPPMRGVWNGSTFTFNDAAPVGSTIGNGGFVSSVDRLGIAPGTTTRVTVGAIYSGLYDSYIDLAPDPGFGSIALPVAFSTAAPAPAPTPTPAWSPAPATAPAPAGATKACRVPGTKGLTVKQARSRLAAAGCRVAPGTTRAYSKTVKAGRVIRTSVAARSTTSKEVRIIVSRGRKGRARASAADQLQELNRLAALANTRAAAR